MQVTCSRCFCVRACRQVCGGGVAYKLPAAGKVRVTCSAPVSAPLWKNIIQCLLMSLFTYRSGAQSRRAEIIHPQVSRSLLTPAASAQRLLTAWAASSFLFCCLLAGWFLVVCCCCFYWLVCLLLAGCRVRADFSNHFQRNSINARIVFRKPAVLMRDCDV